jgi:hypothetical protein
MFKLYFRLPVQPNVKLRVKAKMETSGQPEEFSKKEIGLLYTYSLNAIPQIAV